MWLLRLRVVIALMCCRSGGSLTISSPVDGGPLRHRKLWRELISAAIDKIHSLNDPSSLAKRAKTDIACIAVPLGRLVAFFAVSFSAGCTFNTVSYTHLRAPETRHD